MPTRSNKKTKKKKTKKQKMIVHQIFFNIGKGELHEIPRFYKCYKNNKSKCQKSGIQYKLWSRNMVEKLLDRKENKEYKKLYYDFSQDIMRIDFARYLILYRFGGIYIDLDICMMNKSIKHLFKLPYFFVKWSDSHLPYNALLGTHKDNPLYKEILDHCKESYYEKSKQKIYEIWKGRFVFQTTGHFMLQRVLKKHKIKDFLDILKIYTKDGRIVSGKNPLFEDTSASVWYDKK
jgi:mannosyltransferase OCH1-like enzyme